MLREENIIIGNYTMKEFHDNLILVLLEIDRICKKNNITYVFTGGTALGAVRHNDFIPWDDDADIGMNRKNYNKFLRCCKKDLDNEHFQVDSTKTNKNWGRPYAKIRLKGTSYKEDWNPSPLESQGIWVDLFAYDKCPKCFRKLNRRIGRFFERNKLYKNKANIQFSHKFSAKILSWMPNSFLCFMMKISSSFWNFLPLKNLCNMSFDMEILNANVPKETFEETTNYTFRGYALPLPANVLIMLERKYGDWKTIPEDSKQNPTHLANAEIVLLNDEKIKTIKEIYE